MIDDFDSILLRIYEAGVDPEKWEGALHALNALIGGQYIHFYANNLSSGADAVAVHSRDLDLHEAYCNDYFPQDIRIPRIMDAPVGKILHGDMLWSDEEREASVVYQECFRPLGLFNVTGAQLGLDGHVSWLGFSTPSLAPFEKGSIALLERAFPHVRQALRLCIEMQRAKGQLVALEDLLSRRGRALVVLSIEGKVLRTNGFAEDLVQTRLVSLRHGRLVFREATANRVLNMALAALGSMQGSEESVALMEDRAGNQYGVRFSPIPGLGAALSMLMVQIVPLFNEAPPNEYEIQKFAGLFSLTPSETDTLGALVSGISLAEHAETRGVALDTVRKQMKSVLSKTNGLNQKNLLRMIERFCFVQLR
ncbi:helix-turn-helix transcriptional regulator [Solimonas marina]|uniref:DNA-binding transcriptional regulator, CsgD family n=1 Tax=Solimonas marina TaxID=2714601 RepID=A0A969WE44_9GAMM|nr:hypothetical protein [Solimonas marina]NKF24544.1 hypothetical protein [Solimonas marina]